jgi:glycosyltransferase involved in cell wall biosynthesis
MSAPVLLVTGDFVRTGGMDAANHALASYLARQQQVELHLVAHRVEAELAGQAGVHVHAVPKPASSYFLGAPLLDLEGRRWARRLAARGGRTVVNGGNCDVPDVNWVHYVHAAYRRSAGQGGGVLRRWKTAGGDALYRSQEARRVRAARLVVANSERTKADLVERVGVEASRVRVIYYGIDPERFAPATPEERAEVRRELGLAAEAPVLAFVGALGDRRKGFDVLFEAWKALGRESGGWEAELLVIGTGAERAAWEERAKDQGLTGMRFLGFRSDVPRLLKACDGLVSPTRYEAYGLGVHEALCSGLSALVSAGAGVAERYPPALRELLIPEPESAAGLAAALRTWRERLEVLRPEVLKLSEALRRDTWDTMAERFMAAVAGAP